MDYRTQGGSKVNFAPRIMISQQNRCRLLWCLLLAVCAAGAALVLQTTQNASLQEHLTRQTLEGTWELESVNGEAVGKKTPSPILSQRMSLRQGILRGETVLRADTEAATTKMPFPDESVSKVILNTDETGVRVLWQGTYALDDNQQIALHIGKAIYFVKASWIPESAGLELNQDAVLTMHGSARYRRTLSSASPQPTR